MRQKIGWLLVVLLTGQGAAGQHKVPPGYRNFPVVLTVQFHSLSFPLTDLKANFQHVGFGIGTEIALGSGHAWSQQFQVSWYRNKQAGNGILLYTESAWRPVLGFDLYGEIKAGFGYSYTFRPVRSYRQEGGSWQSAGHQGKWLFTIPMGLSLGHYRYSVNSFAAPFVSYQVLWNTHYNKDIPLITNSIIQVGSAIY